MNFVPFTLEEYRKGKKVYTRYGRNVKILTTNNTSTSKPIIALVEPNDVVSYYINGKYSSEPYNSLDLVIDTDSPEREVVTCACTSPEHIILLTGYPEYHTVYCNIHLNKLPFFKRVIHAIKYIFGYRCRYGDFEEFLITENNKDKIINFINKYI
jgi:hypothetical protein